jgi:hypothetical protein
MAAALFTASTIGPIWGTPLWGVNKTVGLHHHHMAAARQPVSISLGHPLGSKQDSRITPPSHVCCLPACHCHSESSTGGVNKTAGLHSFHMAAARQPVAVSLGHPLRSELDAGLYHRGALAKRPRTGRPSNVSTPSKRPPNTMSKCSLRPL